jgi:colanic acid/amylovoran biosynthesis glycosyltransferase
VNKLAYISAETPLGRGETFILSEIMSLKKLGADILIIPRDRSHELFHKRAEPLLKDALIIPWFDIKIAKEFLKYIYRNPIAFLRIVNDVAFNARNAKIALKNLIILPKALYLSVILKDKSISHIHAHWGSTTSTMAYIISRITTVPWSFTAHRWDIRENNLLKDKCKAASFVRVINQKGRKEMIKIAKDGSLIEKILVVHMGVDMPEINGRSSATASEMFTILLPANLILVKGHKYLIEACRIIADKGIKFKCLIAGDGPLEESLKIMVSDLGLDGCIKFLGRLSHERLLDLYENGRINVVVLPSILTEDGENEGIPVALIEAMSYTIPVISTDTGGIPELIGDGSGIMVKEKESEAIANAILKLRKDPSYGSLLGQLGRKKVESGFNISVISRRLIKLFCINKNG